MRYSSTPSTSHDLPILACFRSSARPGLGSLGKRGRIYFSTATSCAVVHAAREQTVQDVCGGALLECSLNRVTLLSILRVALRSRRCQHNIRQLHDEPERRLTEQTAMLEKLDKSGKVLRYWNETLEVADSGPGVYREVERRHPPPRRHC